MYPNARAAHGRRIGKKKKLSLSTTFKLVFFGTCNILYCYAGRKCYANVARVPRSTAVRAGFSGGVRFVFPSLKWFLEEIPCSCAFLRPRPTVKTRARHRAHTPAPLAYPADRARSVREENRREYAKRTPIDHGRSTREEGRPPEHIVILSDTDTMLLFTAVVVCAAALGCVLVVGATTGGGQKPILQDQIPPLQTTRKNRYDHV